MRYTYLSGQNRTATERTGTLMHAIADDAGYPDFSTALCGKKPGRRSNGWADYSAPAPTCPKCIAKLAAKEGAA